MLARKLQIWSNTCRAQVELNFCHNLTLILNLKYFSGFLRSDQCSITDYVQNIDLHFVNKSCQRYLQLAREIICKDLHNILEINAEVNNTDLFKEQIY